MCLCRMFLLDLTFAHSSQQNGINSQQLLIIDSEFSLQELRTLGDTSQWQSRRWPWPLWRWTRLSICKTSPSAAFFTAYPRFLAKESSRKLLNTASCKSRFTVTQSCVSMWRCLGSLWNKEINQIKKLSEIVNFLKPPLSSILLQWCWVGYMRRIGPCWCLGCGILFWIYSSIWCTCSL